MESPLLGLILDSSVIIAAERKRQTVEDLLASVGRTFGEIEIAISAVTLAELLHGVARGSQRPTSVRPGLRRLAVGTSPSPPRRPRQDQWKQTPHIGSLFEETPRLPLMRALLMG